jgi:SAM-dependent methyltransferase
VLTRAAIFALDRLPRLREPFWRFFYDTAAALTKTAELPFMNFGYVVQSGEAAATLSPADEPNRPYIELYRQLALRAKIAQKDVAEIGAGRGGGAVFLAKNLEPLSYVGIDIAKTNVALAEATARAVGRPTNLRFLPGSAEALPLKDRSVHVVLSVESTHCYRSLRSFAAEVVRVLKTGGTFGWVDICHPRTEREFDAAFRETSLRLESSEDITPAIVAGLEVTNALRRSFIEARIPKALGGFAAQFAGVSDSTVQKDLAEGRARYLRRIYVKDR